MVLILTKVEIAMPPEEVRRIFLDFDKLRTWHDGHFKSVTLTRNAGAQGAIAKGDKVRVVLEHGGDFTGQILENTPTQLSWRGSIPILFTGDHFFRFEASKSTPGGTTFVQGEEFTGLFSFVMRPLWGYGAGNGTKAGFEKLNVDLKRRCEGCGR